MEYSIKISALLLISLLASTLADPTLDCGSCPKYPPKTPKPPSTGTGLPPVPKLPVPIPPVTVPKLPVPIPPVTVPPVVPKLPVPIPPVTVPKLPPVLTPKHPKKEKPCPPPPGHKKDKCPIDTLKLGACVDLLSGLVHIGLGDPAVNKCCPILAGLVETQAAACLCTTLKVKALNLNIYVPLALQLLVSCGKTPPTGYTCSV